MMTEIGHEAIVDDNYRPMPEIKSSDGGGMRTYRILFPRHGVDSGPHFWVSANNREVLLGYGEATRFVQKSFLGIPTEAELDRFLRTHTPVQPLEFYDTARKLGASGRLGQDLQMTDDVAIELRGLYPSVGLDPVVHYNPIIDPIFLPPTGSRSDNGRTRPGMSYKGPIRTS